MEGTYIPPLPDSPIPRSYTTDQENKIMSNNSGKEEEKEDDRGNQMRKRTNQDGNNTGKHLVKALLGSN